MTLHIGFLVTGIAIVVGIGALLLPRLRNRADRSRQKYIDALWATAAAIVIGGIFIAAGLFRPIPTAALLSILICVGLTLSAILLLWILSLRDERLARQRDLTLGVPSPPRPAGFWAVFLPVAFVSAAVLVLASLPYVFLSTLADSDGQSASPTDNRAVVVILAGGAAAVGIGALVAGLRWVWRRRLIRDHHTLLDGIRRRLEDSAEQGHTAGWEAGFDEGYDKGYYKGYYAHPGAAE